jgi:hypothetical protein
MKILGYRRREGNYEGHDYNNYYFYVVVNSDNDSECVGEVVDTVKAKSTMVDMMCSAKKIEPIKFVGMTVQDINYDAHGNFKGFVF